MLLIIIGGIATAFNYLVLAWKFKHKLWKSFFFDLGSFLVLNIVFLGSVTGMAIAMVASFIISVLTLPKPEFKLSSIRTNIFRTNWKTVFSHSERTNAISLPNIEPIIGIVIGSLLALAVLVVL